MPEKTGGEAIAQLLDKVNPDERMAEIRDELQTARATKRTQLNREMKYLQSLKANGLAPREAFMVSKLPVVPANMRPIYTDERGTLISSDLNALYQDVGAVNDQLKNLKTLPDNHKADLRADLYEGVRAVQGLGDPISENKSLKGIFKTIAGAGSPKGGYFQGRVIRSRQNLSGRSTITLGNDLDMDQVGLPEEMAWPLYRDFAVRELVGAGYKKADALEAVKDRTSIAKSALEEAMKKRPVWVNRAPSLHRHSIMALEPVLTPGRDIKISPLVTKSYNADFDGDQMAVHVPVTQEAVDETRGRKPSDMLFATGSDKLMMIPSQSSALGLYLMSRVDKDGKSVGSFDNEKDVLKAIDQGEIKPEDPIVLGGKRTSGGRVQIDQWLPKDRQGEYDELDKKGLNKLLKGIALERPDEFSKVVQGLRALGDEHATNRGFSIGLEDLQPKRGLRDSILDKAAADLKKSGPQKSQSKFDQVYSKASDQIEGKLIDSFKEEDNAIGHMMLAGSRGSPAQARQIFASPVIAQDHQGKIVPVPITNSYADGLDEAEYYSAAFGARAGAVGRSHQTALPGALAKEVLSSVVDSVVSSTKDGHMPSLDLDIEDESDVLNRFVAKPITGRKGKVILKKDGLVTPDVVSEAKRQGVKKFSVYTPLNASAPGGGLPAMAYGVNEQGQLPEIGTNVGVLSGHAMTEPISQMTLDSFHSGATGGTAGRISKFDRIKQLFNLPEDLPGKATLAKKSGGIKTIKKSAIGGWDIDLDGSNHYVDPQNKLVVKEGDTLSSGDRLSEGPIKPQELAQLKGIEAAQDYLVNEIKKETEVDRRAAEVVVGSMTNHAQIEKADILDSIIPGDIVPNWKLQEMKKPNRTARVELPLARGRKLTSDVPGFLKAGDTLTDNDIERLRKGKVEDVEVGLLPPVASPKIKGTNMLPLVKADSDWMAGMGFRRLKDVLGEGALRGRSSDLRSYNPIPAIAQGATFGLGEQGKY